MEKIKKVIFTFTGEHRLPKKGDYYMSENNSYLATLDFTEEKYDIYTREDIEEQWKPEMDEGYFYIGNFEEGIINETYFYLDNDYDKQKIQIGNYFRTRESAEAKLKEIKEILLN